MISQLGRSDATGPRGSSSSISSPTTAEVVIPFRPVSLPPSWAANRMRSVAKRGVLGCRATSLAQVSSLIASRQRLTVLRLRRASPVRRSTATSIAATTKLASIRRLEQPDIHDVGSLIAAAVTRSFQLAMLRRTGVEFQHLAHCSSADRRNKVTRRASLGVELFESMGAMWANDRHRSNRCRIFHKIKPLWAGFEV